MTARRKPPGSQAPIQVRLLVWFTLNPDLPMSYMDLAAKFGESRAAVQACVYHLVKANILERQVHKALSVDGRMVKTAHFLAGPLLRQEIER